MTAHTPRFSVVIPLYNKADTIKRTLLSVAAQTFRDYEVVVVDDGSSDKGVEIVERFDGIRDLRLVRQMNSGVSTARNRGVAEARARYVAFIDADDEWHPDFLMEMDRAIEKYPGAPVYGSDYFAAGVKKSWVGRNWCCAHVRKIDLPSTWCRRIPIHSSSMIVDRISFAKVGGFNSSSFYFEDGELLFKLSLLGRFVVVQRVLSRYNCDAQVKATGREVPYSDLAHLRCLERLLDEGAGDARRFLPVMRHEMRRILVSNRLARNFEKSKAVQETFPRMMKRLRWCDRLLLSQSVLGWMLACVWRIWWSARVRLIAKCVRTGDVKW